MTDPNNSPSPTGYVAINSQEGRLNIAIINYVALNGPCSFEQIEAMVGQDFDAEAELPKLRKRLSSLVVTQRLRASHRSAPDKRWALGPESLNGVVNAQAKKILAEQAAEPKWQGQKATPNCYDVMHAPTYKSDSCPLVRPCSMDFKSVPSRGASC